jgi:hypothetical protein
MPLSSVDIDEKSDKNVEILSIFLFLHSAEGEIMCKEYNCRETIGLNGMRNH